MTVPQNTVYPARGTNAAWQKKKSFLDKAKAKTKTGLGDKLTKAEAAWKKIRWTELDASKQLAHHSLTATANKTKAAAVMVLVAETMHRIDEAAAEANIQMGNKALSKTAQAAAQQISADLHEAHQRLQGVNLTDFDAVIKRLSDKEHLKDVEIYVRKDLWATAASGTWVDASTVEVKSPKWGAGGKPDTWMKGKTVSLRGEYANGTKFATPMIVEEISESKLTLKG